MAKKKVGLKEVKSENEIKKPSHNERQLKWAVFVMLAIILVAVAVYFIIQESKKFNYGGLDFEKIKYGNLPLYHTVILLKDGSGSVIARYNLYLRNDPREMSNIFVNGTIMLKRDAIVSVDPFAESGCSDGGIAGANFFSFFKIAGINVSMAYTDKNYSAEKNASYITCKEKSNQTVIVIQNGTENRIYLGREDCYVIEFKECDILKSTERFMVAAYAQSNGIEI